MAENCDSYNKPSLLLHVIATALGSVSCGKTSKKLNRIWSCNLKSIY